MPAPAPILPALQKAAANLRAGGLVLAEVADGKTFYATAGNPAPRADLPPEKIIFEIGSITKVFTALLLADTVLEGKAALSDPIGQHVADKSWLSPAAAAITLEQLATHTSGLPRLPTNLAPANPADPYGAYTTEKLHAFLGRYQPTSAAPYPSSYSNLGFGLLGHILEQIHGRSYAELIAARIAQPLGLTDTATALDAEQLTRFAAPHSASVRVAPWTFSALAGAGALRSTAADLARFAQALLSDENARLAAAWALVRERRVPLAERNAHFGLAIAVSGQGDDTTYTHNGGTGGFRTHLELIPARRRATIALVNNDSLDPGPVIALARQPPADPTATTREPQLLDAARLAEYPGTYEIDAQRRFTFLIDDQGQLRARLTGQAFLPIFHAGNDRFFARAVAAEFQFARDAAGNLDRMTLHQNGRELLATRVDTPAPKLTFLSDEKLRDYLGIYELAPNVVFEITQRRNTLFAKLTGQPAAPVFCDAPDHFVYDIVVAALTFERDATGAVTALVLHQNGLDQRAPRQASASVEKK